MDKTIGPLMLIVSLFLATAACGVPPKEHKRMKLELTAANQKLRDENQKLKKQIRKLTEEIKILQKGNAELFQRLEKLLKQRRSRNKKAPTQIML